MKHTYPIEVLRVFWARRFVYLAVLYGILFAVTSTSHATDWRRPGAQKESICQGSCGGGCGPCPTEPSRPSYTPPSRDYEAERRAQEAEAAAAAAAERQRQQAEAARIEHQRQQAEAARIERQRQQAEAERIERERVAEEKRKKEFIEDRDRDLATLMDSSGAPMSQGTGNDGLMGGETDPGAQLMGIEHSSREALTSPVAENTFMTPGKADKEMAGKGFDTAGKKAGKLAYPDKIQQQIPPSALDKQIPAGAQDDPEIKQMQAWYRKLDARKAETTQKIAAVEAQLKNGAGDTAVLAAQLGTLKNQNKLIDSDQAHATETVRKKLKKSYHLDLRETPAPAITETEKK